MAFTESLDSPLDSGGTLHDLIGPKHPGGAKPRPLTSSWCLHDRTPPPSRPSRWVFYIDDARTTLAQAATLEDAYRCLLDLGNGPDLTIRPYLITEESLQTEERHRRYKSQHSLR
jgi:hypothetical protein